MVNYGALICLPETTKNRENYSCKRNRLAPLGVIGLVNHTAAMDVMMGLFPSYLQVTKEVAQYAIKLQLVKHLKPLDIIVHLRILNDIHDEPVIKVPDIMTVRLNSERPFKVIVMERHEW